MWSLATEDKKGISNLSGDILTPQTIDPNYVAGFVWTRQYGFRVTKTGKNAAFGVAVENPQLLYTASLAGNTPYAVLGSAGANGGNYNAAISACSPATSIVNYTNQAETDSAGNTVHVAVPVYKTVNGCANIANLSFNEAPDLIVKVAFDPGWGHYEIFGIGGFAHETVYPGETTNSNLYGGLTDIAHRRDGCAPALTTAGYYTNSITLGGVGGSLRVPLIADKLIFGAKGLYGPGMGRYGDSTLADVTANAAGALRPSTTSPACSRLRPTQLRAWLIYLNYGGDYAGRDDYAHRRRHHAWARRQRDFCPTDCRRIHLHQPPLRQHCRRGGKWGGALGRTPARRRRLRLARCCPTPPAIPSPTPGLQRRRFHRLLSRRLLRRANPRRAGNHRRLLV